MQLRRDISNSNSTADCEGSVKMRIQNSVTITQKTTALFKQTIDYLTHVRILIKELEMENSFVEDALAFKLDNLIATCR